MKRVAIIGASGEVGSRLVPQLYTKHELIAVVRNKKKRDFSSFPRMQICELDDVRNVAALAAIIADCDAIINTGYIWFAESIYQAIQISGAQIEHIIFTGSTGIFTKIDSPGAERKRAAERFISKHYSQNWTIIRPTMIYGHRNDRNISRLVKVVNGSRILPLIGRGDGLIQPVLIHDLIKAYDIALLNPRYFRTTYNIGGANSYSNKEIVHCISRLLGKKTWMVPIPPSAVKACINLLGKFRLSPISGEQVLRFQENKNIDLAPFIDEFNYVPVDFDQGVKVLIKDMRAAKLL
jgi:nucleoside-diphosphate-sugar epimerase